MHWPRYALQRSDSLPPSPRGGGGDAPEEPAAAAGAAAPPAPPLWPALALYFLYVLLGSAAYAVLMGWPLENALYFVCLLYTSPSPRDRG